MKTDEVMRAIATGIDETLKSEFNRDDIGFTLLVFEFGKPGTSNYISNAERATMIEALRETADRLERNDGVIGTVIGEA